MDQKEQARIEYQQTRQKIEEEINALLKIRRQAEQATNDSYSECNGRYNDLVKQMSLWNGQGVIIHALKKIFSQNQPVKNQPLSTKKTLLHKILPRSGEKNSGILVLLGILLLGVILIVF
jgi:LPXTG-motif cell wall-anchored protein